MSDYIGSTHAENWTLTTLQLYELKKNSFENEKLLHEDIDTLIELEYETLVHFSRQILTIFGLIPGSKPIIRRKWKIPATAIAFLHRFYTRQNMIEHDPRLMMIAAIFLAGKTEESFVHLQDLLNITEKYSAAKISSAEAVLIEGLNFDLQIYHPHSLHQAILGDLKLWKQKRNEEGFDYKEFSSLVTKWLAAADNLLWTYMTTNIHLKYPPLSIALSALFLVAPSKEMKLILENYFLSQFGETKWKNLKISFLKVTFSSSLSKILLLNQESSIKLEDYEYNLIKNSASSQSKSAELSSMSSMEKVLFYLNKLKLINRWNILTETSNSTSSFFEDNEIKQENKEDVKIKDEQMDIV